MSCSRRVGEIHRRRCLGSSSAAALGLRCAKTWGSEVMRRTLFWGEDLMSMEDVQCSKSESFFFYHYCCRGSSISVGMVITEGVILVWCGL